MVTAMLEILDDFSLVRIPDVPAVKVRVLTSDFKVCIGANGYW